MEVAIPKSPSRYRGQDAIALWVAQIALLLLPFTQFKWLPNIGLTRPLTAVLLVFAISLLFLPRVITNNWSLPLVPGWNTLRWFFLLILFGVISAVFAIVYGDAKQAAARFLGYIIIFSMLYMSMYAFRHRGMEWIARMIVIGYIPAMLYGLVEAFAVLGVGFARTIVYTIRSYTVVVPWWAGRLSLFASEPSFLAFQLVLLIYCIPFLRQRMFRYSAYFLVVLILLFSQSMTILSTVVLYFGIRFLLSGSLNFKVLVVSLSAIASFLAVRLEIFYPIVYRLRNITSDVSLQIRLSYLLNLFQCLLYSWGAGLGIGQYGLFWKEIYIKHIDYNAFDLYGEVARNLASASYMKPWSAVLGVGVDLGVVGLLVLLIFLYKVWKACITTHDKAIFIASLVLIMGAYPIVTPHLWLLFGFIIAKKYSNMAWVNRI